MEASVKQFPKRNTILSYLQSTTAHPTAETLYRMISADHPDISLATVYRNLARFKAEGVIRSLGTVNGMERFDGCMLPHSHMVCRECGCVADILTAEAPESLCREAAAALGWQTRSAELMVYGLCPDCQKKM